MEVAKNLRMNSGIGDSSYANNSIVERKAILNTWPITEEAITDLCRSRVLPKTICFADLGCSSGPNTLFIASEIVKSVEQRRRSLGHESLEFQIYLNDLPSNDFNSIFQSLPKFQENLRQELGSGLGPCFLVGVPGSFYGRLFPTNSLHFVHSASSLMWLSKVPDGLEANKGNICLNSTSPTSVVRAYLNQFQRDFSSFLRCRSEELVANGAMVLSIVGRKSDDPRCKESTLMGDCICRALNDMVSEGLIEVEKLYSFNTPIYIPSPAELKALVEEEGSFTINRLEVFEVHWNPHHSEGCSADELKNAGRNSAMIMRAVHEPLLASHFGGEKMDEVFNRLAEILCDCMSKEKDTVYVSLTMALKKID